MNYKTTLILVLLLALVGGYFYFVEYGQMSGYEAHQQKESQRDQQLEGESLFDGLGTDAISRIDITRADKTVSVVKEEDRWFQAEPVRFPLDDYAPQSVARQFAELRYTEQITPGEPEAATAEQMGLESPRATVTVKADDREITLELGKITLGGHAYVRIEGEETAYVVDSALHGAVLDEAITSWRKTSLDVPEASGSAALQYEQSDGAPFVLHKIDGIWRYDSKAYERVSQGSVDEWFSTIGRVWINEFTEDNPEKLSLYGLDGPYLSLKITDAGDDGATHTLHIGAADLQGENRYAAWTRGDEPITVVFTVNAASVEGLLKTRADLRDPNVIDADTYDVRDLLVEQNGRTTLHLVRDPQEGYSFGEPGPGFDVDYGAAHGMVDRLCQLESTRFVEQLSSLGDPVATVRITLAGDKTANFSVYNQGDDRAIVSEGESVGYLVAATELDALLGTPMGLRDRTVMDIESGSLAGMTLRRDDGQVFTFEPVTSADDQARSWRLVGHDGYEAEAFDALLDSLNPLQADRWLSEPIEPLQDWIEWKIEPVGGAAVTIKVSADTGEALMSGIDSAFVLPESLIDMLTAEYRERTVLNIDMDQIASVRLASDLTSVILAKDGQRYTIDVGEVDQAQAAAVFDTLSGLRVSRYVAPLNLRPADIDFTIELATQDGEAVMLRVVAGEGDMATVRLDGSRGEGYKGWFKLTREVVNRLRAPLTEAETPIK